MLFLSEAERVLLGLLDAGGPLPGLGGHVAARGPEASGIS